MKIIVSGAGKVGQTLAAYLAEEKHDVTLIDNSPELVALVNETLDVSGIVGSGSHPDTLERAGAREADMLIAATPVDEINMVSCQVAHTIFGIKKKIARIREESYLSPTWSNLFSRDHMPIDMVISPEKSVARAIMERINAPGSFNIIPLVEGHLQLVSVLCNDDCPVINTPMKQLYTLFPDLLFKVVAIIRGNEKIVPEQMDQIRPKDEVYFVVASEHMARTMAAFGHEEKEARRILIVGGGNIGICLAQELHARNPSLVLRMIEQNPEKARYASEILPGVLVFKGNALTRELLEEANIGYTEAVVSVTNHDESNILVSLLASEYGDPRTIALLSNPTYTPMASSLGIDAVVNPRSITISSILRHVRYGHIKSAVSLRDGFAEVMEVEVPESSTALLYKPLRSMKLPDDTILGAIIRKNKVIIAHPETVLHPNDRVILLTSHKQINRVEAMFSASLYGSYF
ncbi:MAG: Trk system potassium transporter TrkA [Micavibrio sp.]|nr:MAG: Trk system potassium transporter TrkA [Micavibrio sp.]